MDVLRPHVPINAIRVECHTWLPSGTIVVSKDIWDLFQSKYSEEAIDQQFLKLLGISNADTNSQ